MEITQALLFIVGLVFLIGGAEMLVRGASRLAGAIGISPLVVGLTVVAFGTSAPELAVSIQSSVGGQGEISLGNVVGSNIFNILFILGLSAAITPLIVAQKLIRIDVPIMIGVTCLAYLLGANGVISRWEGAILFSGIVLYTLFAILQSRRENRQVERQYEEEFGPADPLTSSRMLVQILLVLGGFGLLALGSRWLVDGSIAVARSLQVSDLVIGLTLVAVGTSLPEVATSAIASFRGERDIAVGNVVGSNIFNLLGVLGASALFSPEGVAVSARALHFDFLIMIAVAAACLPVFFTGHLIARWEGGFFLVYYLIYTFYLISLSTQPTYLPLLSDALLFFVIPLSAVTLIVLAVRALRLQRKP